MICVRFSLMCVIVMVKWCQSFLASTSTSGLHIQQTDSTTFVHIFFYLFSLILHYPTMLSNESIKRISITIIINQSIILELFNSCTSLNALFNCIPSSVSDGMSISDTIINHHSPISLSLYNRNAIHLL